MQLAAAYVDPEAFGAAGGTAGTGVGAVFGLLTVLILYFTNRRGIRERVLIQEAKGAVRKENTSRLAWVIVRTAAPIIAGTAVLSFSNLIDATMVTGRLMAGGFSSVEADVLYGQLSGKYSHVITLPISMATVLAVASIPSISSSKILKDKAAIEAKIKTALRLAMLICVPAAAGLAALGEPIIAMLFRSHPEGGMLLQVGAVNVIFIALNQIMTGPLQATGYVKIPVIAALAGCAVKIAANMLLIPIPFINIHGAVLSTMLCYITASSINGYWLRKTSGVRLGFLSLMKKPVFASAVMGGICFGVHRLALALGLGNTVAVLSAIGLGFLVYAGMMLAIRGIAREDLVLLPFGRKLDGRLGRRK
jgi:stage V sporulation protein B